MKNPHIPVLKNEVCEVFSKINSGYIIDCTLGYAGHTKEILKTNKNVKILGFDKDITAINFSKEYLKEYENRVVFIHDSFSNVFKYTKNYDIKGVLADIGVSSLQLDKLSRGFSLKSEILDMRMNEEQSFDAKELINNYTLDELTRVIYDFAELKNAKELATKIVNQRNKKPIFLTKDLLDIIGNYHHNKRKVKEATLVFQALRMEVNDELGELVSLLKGIEKNLKNAIIAIISFHSLEDRIVKRTFKIWQQSCICDYFVSKCECGNNHSLGKIITKKPITPSDDELKINKRAKSSKMRVFEIKHEN